MSGDKLTVCSLMLKQQFGDVVEKVGLFIMQNGTCPFRMIVQKTGMTAEQVRNATGVLVQHNICHHNRNPRGYEEYSIAAENILVRIRFPNYVYTAKTLYGESAELIIEEMLTSGRIQMSLICEQVAERLALSVGPEEKSQHSIFTVRDKFTTLANTHFIQRCIVDREENEDEDLEKILYEIPNLDFSKLKNRKRKRSTDDSSQAKKKQKTDAETVPDQEILWRVNYDRFQQYLRDQAIVGAVARKIDKRSAEVVRTILRLSEVRSLPDSPYTNPLSYHEILSAMPSDHGVNKQVLDQALKIITEDSIDFVHKTGDSGGGMYSVNFKKALTALCTAHIESVIQERFGSKSLRIFRLLLMKKQLEQKRVEDCVMIPAKEVKDLLYRMFGENFLHLTEVAKTPDHAPSRTFFLFSVNIAHLSRMLLERCYKTLYNLMRRRELEIKEQKRLLDKQQRVDAIVASLEQQGADDGQAQEIQDTITPSERAIINKVKYQTNMLEQSELQIDETIIIMEMYLQYCNMK